MLYAGTGKQVASDASRRDFTLPVSRIERIIGGVVKETAELSKEDGKYHCHVFGSNIYPEKFSDLDDVADFCSAIRDPARA